MDKQTQKLLVLKKQMMQIAQEEVTVEQICDNYYIYGSELATLRIYRKYQGNENVKQDYSTNLKTFYFKIEGK